MSRPAPNGNKSTDTVPKDVRRARLLREVIPAEVNAVHHERIHAASVKAAENRPRGRAVRTHPICWDCGVQGPFVGPTGCEDKEACARNARNWEVI